MKRTAITTALAAAFALTTAGIASAQTATDPTMNRGGAAATEPADRNSSPTTNRADARGRADLPRAETAFLKQAAQNGHAEVESSKLALQKAANPEVKRFAQQMVDDHTKANAELKALAAAKGVELPDGPSLMQTGKMKLLGTADGDNFDRRYAEAMGVEAHRDTIELFEKASADATDADVKAFAQKTLPTLKHHLMMAEQLQMTAGKASQSSVGEKSRNAMN